VPATLFFGATFLVLADFAACLWEGAGNRALPVGVLTAMCGGPFFIYLLRTRWRRMMETR
jgi:iron complex transport system permease protein